jgi:hypothetical protein
MEGFHPKLVDALDIISKEPNYQKFAYKGYLCIVKRLVTAYHFWGNLNGYVILEKGHKYHGKGSDEIDVDCHGGLTWSSEAKELFPDELFTDEWVIGFDCAHYGDMQPFLILREIFQRPPMPTAIIDDPFVTYKDFEYVREQCIKIVDQLN